MTEKELEKIKLKHLKNNLQIYSDNESIVLLYDEYIKKIVELFDFLGVKKDDLFYTIVFNILMEIGYFSYQNNFDIDQEKFEELSIRPGINVVSGVGVCRNVACFYEDIFKHFYDYPLKLCCFDKYGTSDKDTIIYGNHMINLTFYRDAIYGFDIMNHCLFKPINDNKLKGFDVNYYLTYKEYGDLLMRLTTNLEQDDDFILEAYFKKVLLNIASRKKALSMDEYQDIINKANEFILDRKSIFKSFLETNKHYHEEIKIKMLSLK